MSDNKVIKQGIGRQVTPAGDFVNHIVIELARRIIRGGEKVVHLMEEVKERFPDVTPKELYTIMGELQQLGFDVTINEFLYFTPVENRVAALKESGIFKSAKIYGSRYEDILEALKEAKSHLKDIQAWIKDHADCKRLSPQEYYSKSDMVPTIEQEIDQLNESLKLSKASVLYDKTYGGGVKPLMPLGISVEDNVYFICRTADNMITKSVTADLMVKSAFDEMVGEMEQEPELPLHAAFDKLGSKESLKPFWSDWKVKFGDVYDSPERIAKAIDDLLAFIQNQAQLKQMDEKEIDLAYEELDQFIKQVAAKGVNLQTRIAEYKAPKGEFGGDDKVQLGGPESKSDTPDPEIQPTATGFMPSAGPVGGMPPAGEGNFTPVTTTNQSAMKTAADTQTAGAIMFLDKIAKLLSEVKASVTIPKTAHVDAAIDSLQGTLREIKNYVETELPHNNETERKAAHTVLSNIMKRLAALVDIYSSQKGDVELMKYLVSSNILKTLKTSKILLTTLGA